MKFYQIVFFFIFLLFQTFSCKTAKTTTGKNTTETENNQDYSNAVFVYQNGKEIPISNYYQIVELEKEDFSIRFFGGLYAYDSYELYMTKIAAVPSKSHLKKIDDQININELPYFSAGSGLAAEETGYSALYVNDYGHHFLYYFNEEDRRVDLLSRNKNRLKMEFNIAKINVAGEDFDVKDAPLEELNLAVFITDSLRKNGTSNLFKFQIVFK